MTPASIAATIRSELEGIGIYGRTSGMRPWVVADVERHFSHRPTIEGQLFLLRTQGYSWHEMPRELGVSYHQVLQTKRRLRSMASLLDVGVMV